jgi:hypothetical protein
VDGLKSVVMIWGEAMTLVGGLKLIWESNLISCFFAKYFSILWSGMAVYDTL